MMLPPPYPMHWFFYLINTTLLVSQSGILACISSRITTVIQVALFENKVFIIK